MLRNIIYGAAFIIVLFIATPVQAQQPAGQDYTFGNPMPLSQLGLMYTDRPMRAKSPFTVGPGRFQVETSVFSYLWDDNHFKRERISIGDTTLRVGFAKNLEAGVTIEPLIWQWLKNGVREDDFGLGDTEFRLKYHVYGPNYPQTMLPQGESALAVAPFFTLPTGTDDFGLDRMSFGVEVPIYFNVGGPFTVGLTPGIAYIPEGDVFGDEDDEYIRVSNALALFYPFQSDLAGFVEFFARARTEEWSDWEGSMDGGILYQLTHEVQLNASLSFGLTDEAPDFTTQFGFAWRF
ncbi:MAG TPA: transporter [Deltaproteobacteria bacterium]|nr:transporter [Deltaproteobacteria bacterium]HQA71096.1 transporter [Deltaproteobacteria bacterium]